MAEVFLLALSRAGFGVVSVNKSISRSAAELRSFSVVKLFRVLSMLLSTFVGAIPRPGICVSFISSTKLGFVADVFALILLRVLRVPYVLYFHGMGFLALAERGRVWRWAVSQTIRHAQHHVVLGRALIADIDPWVEHSTVSIIPNCLRSDASVESKSASPDRIRVVFLSNLLRAKGAADLVEAFSRADFGGKTVSLEIAGAERDAAFCKEIQEAIAGLAPDRLSALVGAKYGCEKEEFLSSADIFVFPTRVDSFGLVNLEAMQHGLPVVSTRVGAIPEIVQHGTTGLLIEPGDTDALKEALETLVLDDSLRAEMGARGRERFLAEYTLGRYSARWAELLESLSR